MLEKPTYLYPTPKKEDKPSENDSSLGVAVHISLAMFGALLILAPILICFSGNRSVYTVDLEMPEKGKWYCGEYTCEFIVGTPGEQGKEYDFINKSWRDIHVSKSVDVRKRVWAVYYYDQGEEEYLISFHKSKYYCKREIKYQKKHDDKYADFSICTLITKKDSDARKTYVFVRPG